MKELGRPHLHLVCGEALAAAPQVSEGKAPVGAPTPTPNIL
jgi:hypothetical protein